MNASSRSEQAAAASRARSGAARARIEARKDQKPLLVRKAHAGFLLTGDPAGNDDLIDSLIADGKLEAKKLGRLTMVTLASVERAVEALPPARMRQAGDA